MKKILTVETSERIILTDKITDLNIIEMLNEAIYEFKSRNNKSPRAVLMNSYTEEILFKSISHYHMIHSEYYTNSTILGLLLFTNKSSKEEIYIEII